MEFDNTSASSASLDPNSSGILDQIKANKLDLGSSAIDASVGISSAKGLSDAETQRFFSSLVGDVVETGAGNNTAGGTVAGDTFIGTEGTNSLTTGVGRDLIVSAKGAVNTVKDFNAGQDKIGLTGGLTLDDISVVSARDGVKQSFVVEESSGEILNILSNVSVSNLTSKNFVTVDDADLTAIEGTKNFNKILTTDDSGETLSGNLGFRDKIVGGAGDDVLNLKPTGLNAQEIADQQFLGKLNGDFLDAGAGTNVITSGGDSDIVIATEGNNTITTGTGQDVVVIGKEATNKVFDFDAAQDKIALTDGLTFNDLIIEQGTNPLKAGIDQPIDSVNNVLIKDKATGELLTALAFDRVTDITANNFISADAGNLEALSQRKFEQELAAGDGGEQLNGGLTRDKMTGGAGDDFLYLGDESFSFGAVTATGPGEFPFPNESKATGSYEVSLKSGVFSINGDYKDFEGSTPLFVNGVDDVVFDEDVVIPNQAAVDGLIQVFQGEEVDDEGNPISGFHLHIGASGFADGTVERYMTVDDNGDGSGKITGEFELDPVLQAALLAGDTYLNGHSKKHPAGEVRGEFNTVQYA